MTPARRTQAQRTAETRGRILDAAVECLVERGYARTTVEEVARRAGVSLGAERHHFPSKIELLTHSVRHLFEGLAVDYATPFSALPIGPGRAAAALRVFWRSFQDPRTYAALEIYFASRTDQELREAFTPVATAHGANFLNGVALLFPEAAAANPRFHVTWGVIIDVLQGMAIGHVLFGQDAAPPDQLAFLEELAETACAIPETET
jgi:AcrR family transcriptional regulator